MVIFDRLAWWAESRQLNPGRPHNVVDDEHAESRSNVERISCFETVHQVAERRPAPRARSSRHSQKGSSRAMPMSRPATLKVRYYMSVASIPQLYTERMPSTSPDLGCLYAATANLGKAPGRPLFGICLMHAREGVTGQQFFLAEQPGVFKRFHVRQVAEGVEAVMRQERFRRHIGVRRAWLRRPWP